MSIVVISASRRSYTYELNDWWNERLAQYLRDRGYKFVREGDQFFVNSKRDMPDVHDDSLFNLRLIAQRFGQSRIGICRALRAPHGSTIEYEPLF